MFQLLRVTQKDEIQKEQSPSAWWREVDPHCAAAAARELTASRPASPPCLSAGRVSRKGGFAIGENRQP